MRGLESEVKEGDVYVTDPNKMESTMKSFSSPTLIPRCEPPQTESPTNSPIAVSTVDTKNAA